MTSVIFFPWKAFIKKIFNPHYGTCARTALFSSSLIVIV